jgi:hypothetical protein
MNCIICGREPNHSVHMNQDEVTLASVRIRAPGFTREHKVPCCVDCLPRLNVSLSENFQRLKATLSNVDIFARRKKRPIH